MKEEMTDDNQKENCKFAVGMVASKIKWEKEEKSDQDLKEEKVED